MRRPRVIAADTKEEYIRTLISGLAGAFYEKIDLEVITDEDYFAELFKEPQTADVLLVSEDLYTDTLKRHNIGKIFLLTETSNGVLPAGVKRLEKYAGIREITETMIREYPLLDFGKGERKTTVIAVTSASGGTGKTTVALGIAACLSAKGREVLYIATDGLQGFRAFLDAEDTLPEKDVYEALMNGGEPYKSVKHCIKKDVFHYLPPLKTPAILMGLERDVLVKVAQGAAGSRDYDFVIVDTDSAFDENKLKDLSAADSVIFVTKQDRRSQIALEMMLSHLNTKDMGRIAVITNDHRSSGEDGTDAVSFFGGCEMEGLVEHAEGYDRMRISDLPEIPGMRRAAYLFL